MTGEREPWGAADRGAHTPRAVEAVCGGPTSCRCGRRLRAGERAWTVRDLPPSLLPLLELERFCGRPCLRAFLLEALETIGALDRPESQKVVSDLHRTFLELRQILEETGTTGRAD